MVNWPMSSALAIALAAGTRPLAGRTGRVRDVRNGKSAVSGEHWALKSAGRCFFIMPKGEDFDAIRALLTKKSITGT